MQTMARPLWVLLLFYPLLVMEVASDGEKPYNPDVYLNTPQIIRRHGYPAESHTVQTEDGYLLTMHRIPHGRSKSNLPTESTWLEWYIKNLVEETTTTTLRPTPPSVRRPILLHHGLLGSSFCWILAGPEKGLAYLLADAGYDVWMANARGSWYSRAHAYLPTDSSSPFWNFSFHEMGIYDLPAEIEYILNITGSAQLNYIGHSMGTTTFFVMASTRPDIAAKVTSSLALAPVVFLRHIKSPIRLLAPFSQDLEYLAHLLGEGELVPHSRVLQLLSKYGCELLETDKRICEHMMFIICGFDAAQFDQKLLPVMLGHQGNGASTQTVIHYAQLINTGKFQQYDYGIDENLRKYNSTVPPQYDLSKVNVPVHLYYASNDWLAAIIDVDNLYQNLTCKKTKYLVPLPSFNHIDFIIAKDIKKLLYDEIIHQLPQYGDDKNIQLPQYDNDENNNIGYDIIW